MLQTQLFKPNFKSILMPILLLIQRHWRLCSLLVLTAITILSLYPVEFLPPVPGSDKTHHFIAYALLMFPVTLARPKHWLWIGLFFLAWSGAIELIQPYVNRYGEWLDLLANATGLGLGILLALLLRKVMPVSRKN